MDLTGREEAAYIRLALVDPQTLDLYPVDGARFSSPRHRKALETLEVLHAEGRGTYVELDAIMGAGYCNSLPELSAVPYTASTLVCAIGEQAQRRDLHDVLVSLQAAMKDPTLSIRERLTHAVGQLLDLQEQAEQVASFGEVLQKAFQRVEKAWEAKGALGIPTGWVKLDEKIGGWEPEKLYFVSARPGAGKTSFGLQTITEAAKTGVRVYVSSQEMGQSQVGMRLLSQEGRVSTERMRVGLIGDADWPKLTRAAGVLQQLPGWIDTRTGVTFNQLRSSILRCHTRQPIGLVLVDYVQMMRGEGEENKVYELEAIAYGLKSLAKELQAPVIALSQLNRGAEEDEAKAPKLSQMRGSGGLEQAADVVIILWAPKKDQPNTIEVRIAKHRDGPTGKFPTQFNRELTLFE